MCGVIGASFKFVTDEDVKLVERVILESMIRGKHATGVTYLSDGKLTTIKSPVPADVFLRDNPVSYMVDKSNPDCHRLRLIAHTRYSTSDLRYNQPFSNGQVAIVHNGVVSQEDMSEWKYKTETANDSELILRSVESGSDPLHDFPDASMAVVQLTKEGLLIGYRNDARPLWYTNAVPRGKLFASTRDILVRAGINPSSPQKVVMDNQVWYDGKITHVERVMNREKEDLQHVD